MGAMSIFYDVMILTILLALLLLSFVTETENDKQQEQIDQLQNEIKELREWQHKHNHLNDRMAVLEMRIGA